MFNVKCGNDSHNFNDTKEQKIEFSWYTASRLHLIELYRYKGCFETGFKFRISPFIIVAEIMLLGIHFRIDLGIYYGD